MSASSSYNGQATFCLHHGSALFGQPKMIDTSLFTVPIIPVPAGGEMHTPASVPVFFEGEHVADAVHRDGDYVFRMFRGHLQQGLSAGTLLLQPRFKDVTSPGAAVQRFYLGVEIVRRRLENEE